MKKGLTVFMTICGIFISSFETFETINKDTNQIRKIVIDAGHGGHDPGCLGSKVKEKDIAYDIATELGSLIRLHQKDVEVIFTRNKREEFLGLYERASFANREGADLFISIHCNAAHNHQARGTETYLMGVNNRSFSNQVVVRENSSIYKEENYKKTYNGFDPTSPVSYILLANYEQSFQENSIRLAAKVQDQFAKHIDSPNRGVKQEAFIVLAHTAMPSVLVETGFLSNKDDENFLMSKLGKAHVASCIYRAFRDYKLEIEGKESY